MWCISNVDANVGKYAKYTEFADNAEYAKFANYATYAKKAKYATYAKKAKYATWNVVEIWSWNLVEILKLCLTKQMQKCHFGRNFSGNGGGRVGPPCTDDYYYFLFFTNTSNLCYQINWKSQNIFRMASLNESWSVPICSFPFDWSEKVTLMNDIERQDILVFIDSGWKDTSIVL